MHNCKALRETLLEMALNKVAPDQNQFLSAELERCGACREEYASLRNGLRIADQAMQFTLPAENFWPDYNLRLRQRLQNDSAIGVASRYPGPPSGSGILVWLRQLVTASVAVPVPLASAVVVLFVFSIAFTIYSRRTLSAAPETSPPTVITKMVEVPIIQERPVTRVVYLEKDRRTTRAAAPRRQAERNVSTSVAGRQTEGNGNTPVSLVGFKPASDIKLTIIKGSYRDDK
jgi:hypothetical protein